MRPLRCNPGFLARRPFGQHRFSESADRPLRIRAHVGRLRSEPCLAFGRVYCQQATMTPTTGGVRERSRMIDTRGEEPFGFVYLAVVATEVVVLTGLWWFSQYFSG